jgi:hypothetical protein
MLAMQQSDVDASLRRFLHEGFQNEWERAVEVADGPTLLIALARELASAGRQELIILRRLAPHVARRRPELLKNFDHRVLSASRDRKFQGALQELENLLDQGVPEPSSREELLRRINQKVEAGCTALDISGRVRKDLLAADLEEEALKDRSLASVVRLDDAEAQQIADMLTKLASNDRSHYRRPLPLAKRARLILQAAKILLIPPRSEDRTDKIRRAIGTYCCRQAQVFSDDRDEIDAAQDYALEAVRYQNTSRDFPVALFFHTALVQFHKQQGSDVIPRFHSRSRAEDILNGSGPSNRLWGRVLTLAPDQHEERLRILGLALLRLAFYERDIALRYFRKVPLGIQTSYIKVLVRCLDVATEIEIDPLEQFDAVAANYRERVNFLHETLRHAAQASSLREISGYSIRLQEFPVVSSLVSFHEQEAIKEIVQAAARCQLADEEIDPNSRRGQLRAGRDSLKRAQEHGRSLSFGMFIDPLVRSWQLIIDRGIEETLLLIRPEFKIQPYKNTLLRRGNKGLVQLQLRNVGRGVATGIEVFGFWLGQELHAELDCVHLTPGQDTLLTLSGSLAADVGQVEVEVKINCTDVEGAVIAFPESRLLFTAPPSDFDFEKKRTENPFNAGDVVKDPEMFMGREGILQQLQEVITAKSHCGALRLLFGQRRVGKSSILYFLDQRLGSLTKPTVLCSHVTWLNFASHGPGHVIYEIAKALVRSAKLHGFALPEPIEAGYRDNYSLHLNDLVDRLFALLPEVRLALLIDEFDKAYNQLTDPRLGYDEPFFGYLRGLSLRDNVSVILAGGEELPAFLRELGSTYNNARRIRVSFLDDESVNKLIRNKYVEWLDFPDPVVELIATLTHANPYFTQMVCGELYDVACDQHSLQISTLDVENVGRTLVSDRLDVEQMAHLYQFDGPGKVIGPALLHLLSREATLFDSLVLNADELVRQLKADTGSIRQALNTLREREVVQSVPERPSHVRIAMPLFAAWFREHCPLNSDAWKLLPEVGAP